MRLINHASSFNRDVAHSHVRPAYTLGVCYPHHRRWSLWKGPVFSMSFQNGFPSLFLFKNTALWSGRTRLHDDLPISRCSTFHCHFHRWGLSCTHQRRNTIQTNFEFCTKTHLVVEMYLGSTFSSCFGDGYRSTCFGRESGTEEEKKKKWENLFLET